MILGTVNFIYSSHLLGYMNKSGVLWLIVVLVVVLILLALMALSFVSFSTGTVSGGPAPPSLLDRFIDAVTF